MYPVDGYEDSKVMRDPRIRISNLLAERGLLRSEYARQIMSIVPADKQPRRDMIATLNKLE